MFFFSLFKIWLSFAPVADHTAKYYNKSLDDINWLSIVYLLSYLLFGLVAVWILDVLGLRTGVRISFLLQVQQMLLILVNLSLRCYLCCQSTWVELSHKANTHACCPSNSNKKKSYLWVIVLAITDRYFFIWKLKV